MELNINFWGVAALVSAALIGRYIAKKEIEKTLGTDVKTNLETKLDQVRVNLYNMLEYKFGHMYNSADELDADIQEVTTVKA